MLLKNFHVVFDRANVTYSAGELVTGKIVLDINRAETIRGMYVTVKGNGRVLWMRHEKKRLMPVRIASETYMDLKFDIIGTQSFDSRAEITAGYHEYQFSYQLPHRIPSSYKDKIGKIQYKMKVVIDRPWKRNHKRKSPFNVICPLNLNDHSTGCGAINDVDRINFYDLCCLSHPNCLDLTIGIPTAGYIPGQVIYTKVDYDNLSKRVKMTRITTNLKREVVYHAKILGDDTKEFTSSVKATKIFGPFPKQGQIVLELLIPPVPPSNLQFCKIIDLTYKLFVTVHVSGMHLSIEKTYPILIGTTTVLAAMPMPMSTATQMPTPMPTGSAPCAPPLDYVQMITHQPPIPQQSFPSDIASTNNDVNQGGSHCMTSPPKRLQIK